ncbi:MAG: FAD-binding oxidoreductase, partial [Pseudomonadota bacterium]
LQEAGLRELNRVVTEQEIACELQPWGNLYGALGGEDEILLDRMVERYRDAGKALEHWSAEQMAEVTGSARFVRGLFHPGTVLVQPVKLIRGLTATLPQNVVLFENSPVDTVVHRNGGYHLHTARSRIAVERLFLCANGGTPTLGFGKHRLLQVATFAAMTPPLELDGLLSDTMPFGVLPLLPGGATLRFTQDRRLIVRQGAAFAPSGYVSDADLHRFLDEAARTLAVHWPALAGTAFDYVWGGVMSLTRNNAQLFGEQGPGLFVAAFCNGAGNTAGTAAGKLLAELAAGEQSDLLVDQMSLPRPARLPPDFVNGFVVRHRIAQARRRLERLYASVDHPSPGQEGRRQA